MARSLVDLRQIVVSALGALYRNEGTLDQVLFLEFSKRSKNTPTDFERSWCFEALSGVARHKGRLDYIIDTYSERKKPTGMIRRVLQVATYQLLEQEAPQALVVSESVSMVQNKEGKPPAQFVNALLRKIASSTQEWREWGRNKEVLNSKNKAEGIAWSSLPEWWFVLLSQENDLDWLSDYILGSLERPSTWWVDAETLKPTLEVPQKGFVQDLSNQELSEEVAHFLKLNHHESSEVLDWCAAPGGKSMNLALRGFKVTASDLSETRMQRLIENRSRLNLVDSVRIVSHQELLNDSKLWDVIWLDVPCTSSGIIRRHPEIKWNRGPEHLQEMILEQQKIFDHALAKLKPQGVLIYSTCSVFKKENQPRPPRQDSLEAKLIFKRCLIPGSTQPHDAIQATAFIKK